MRTILLASVDPALTDLRKRLLEAVGYQIIVANTVSEIARRCLNRKIDLVLIGSSLSAEQKRRFWAESRDQCSFAGSTNKPLTHQPNHPSPDSRKGILMRGLPVADEQNTALHASS